jgi:hypothetical protein
MNFANDDLNLRNRNFKIAGLLLALASFLPLPSMAADAPEYYQLVADYKTPDVSVVRQDGKKLSFLKELDDGRP